jgi:hypothetical protein
MKAEDSLPVNTGKEESGQNPEGALRGAETDVTTRLRTKAEGEQEGGLMEAVVERGNLWLAYDRVVKNKGAAGVDGIGIDEFKDPLKQHWPTIKAKLLSGEYMPSPVRRVDIPAILISNSGCRKWRVSRGMTQIVYPVSGGGVIRSIEHEAHQMIPVIEWNVVDQGAKMLECAKAGKR